MVKKSRGARVTGRRDFLLQLSGAAAVSGVALNRAARGEERRAVAAEPRPAGEPLPTIKLGKHQVTRLIAGWNPIGGHSHTTLNMARVMQEYFTVERTVEFLERCERAGINTWQYDHVEKGVQALRRARERGSKLQCICLHAERKGVDAPVKQVMAEAAPIALVHHGGVTDAMFRAGKQQQVHDFVKKVHDHGALAGVSAHKPENIKQIADEGWENDLFMTCFYYVTRQREEQEKLMGRAAVGEPFFDSDPLEMTKVVRQVDQPCLGFKILAAGRLCWSQGSVQQAFKFAFGHIKPTDGVIVGIFPKYYDEIADDADYARKFGVV